MLLAVLLAGATARADGIVLETYTAQRPDDASRLLAPLHDELAARGYRIGDQVGRSYEHKVSRPSMTKEGVPPDFVDRVDRGHRAWIAGHFDEAISILNPVVSVARANTGAFVQNEPLHDGMRKAQIALALAHHRRGDVAEATSTIAEILRSFPNSELSRAQYGPEAYELFEQVRRAHGQGGRGRLRIKVPLNTTVVFVNELYSNVGNATKHDLVPGTYRVYTQSGHQLSRVHLVTVRADQTTEHTIDASFDAALQTRPGFAGFVFSTTAERREREGRYALQVANQLGATSLIVIGLDTAGGRKLITGALLDLQTGRDLRRANLALEPEPTAERLRSLAGFLAGDEPVDGIEVQVRDASTSRPELGDRAAGSSRRWLIWPGLGGIAAGIAGGALSYRFVGDARDARDELARVCAVVCGPEEARGLERDQQLANRRALVAGIAGGAFAVTGILLVIASRTGRAPDPALDRQLSIQRVPGGTVLAFTLPL